MAQRPTPVIFLRRSDYRRIELCNQLGEYVYVVTPINTEQALALLAQAFDALEATADSDIDTFEDEEEEALAVPAQYACRKIIQAMQLLRA